MPSSLHSFSAKPAIGSVSRWAQAFFTQSLPRPDLYRPSRTLDTTPSSPTWQACWYISWSSTSKLSLNCTSVSATSFLSSALRSTSGCVDVPSVGRDLPEAIGPVVAATGEDLYRWRPGAGAFRTLFSDLVLRSRLGCGDRFCVWAETKLRAETKNDRNRRSSKAA